MPLLSAFLSIKQLKRCPSSSPRYSLFPLTQLIYFCVWSQKGRVWMKKNEEDHSKCQCFIPFKVELGVIGPLPLAFLLEVRSSDPRSPDILLQHHLETSTIIACAYHHHHHYHHNHNHFHRHPCPLHQVWPPDLGFGFVWSPEIKVNFEDLFWKWF